MSASDNSRKNFSLLQILGWFVSGLSLLNLIEELSAMKIYGNLKKWLDAYTGFVEKIGGFLFGWIDFYWMKISDLEMHILVLSIILITAFCRARLQQQKLNAKDSRNPITLFFSGFTFFFFPMFLTVLLIPTWFGLLGAGIVFLFMCLIFFYVPDEVKTEGVWPKRKAIFDELIGVAAVFFFLIALNYTVFKSWS